MTSFDFEDRDVFLMQYALKSLGFDPGALDGDLGPLTRSALSAFDASRVKPTTVAQRMVTIAVAERGVRETSKNQGPGIAKYWSATPHPEYYDQRAPYCAAFVCWTMREALPEEGLPAGFKRFTSPVAYDVEAWARSMKGKGVLLLDADAEILPGDIITLSVASHVLIATKGGKGTFDTIEGNTDGSGSREGDGVYTRNRPRTHIRKIIRLIF